MAPPLQLYWGEGCLGDTAAHPRSQGGGSPLGVGGGLQSRTKGSGDLRGGSGCGVQRAGSSVPAAQRGAPPRRKPGTAPPCASAPGWALRCSPKFLAKRPRRKLSVPPGSPVEPNASGRAAPAWFTADPVSRSPREPGRRWPRGGVSPWSWRPAALRKGGFLSAWGPLLPKQSVSLYWSFKARRSALALSWVVGCALF